MSDAPGYESRTEHTPLVTEIGGGSGAATKLFAVASAIALAAALFVGFLVLRKKHEDKLAATKRVEQQQAAQSNAPPQAQIFQDEVRLKGSAAFVSGTIKNISDAQLEGLSVEIALKGRAPQQGIEKRSVSISPDTLRPGEEGKYALQISPDAWSGAQVVRLHSNARNADVPFRPEMGERRPAERPPDAKVIIEQRPRRKGDDYINTPDTPIRIP
ncbi:MAG: hypothetical protein QOE33_701 [Acidobacteriota bacterium]|nr:hypothetical protein [Acidobacteriota bacterium]